MHILRACALCSAGAAVVSLTFVCLRAAESQPGAAKSPDLQQRVTALEEKVARLEKQLAEQAQQGYPFAVPPAAPLGVAPQVGARPAPVVPQTPPGVPPNSIPHIFNGQTYYIVPLGKDAARK